MLIPFPFTDLSDNKVRPAVVISNNLKGNDVIVAFISSKKLKELQPTDISIKETDRSFRLTGLKTNSTIKLSKLATLEKKIILGELGKISVETEKEITKKLKMIFGI